MPQYFNPAEIVRNLEVSSLKGAKVVFINMPIREQALPNNAPLGPALLSAQLLKYGATDVNIIDLNAYRIKDHEAQKRGLINGRALNQSEVRGLIERFISKNGDQDLVALSGLITTLDWQKSVAKIIRKLQPQAVLASGGGLATEFREILFDWIPELDAIAHSEGDDVILKMALDALILRRNGVTKCQNSDYLKPYCLGFVSGRPRFFYDGGRPKSLDALPYPAWDLLNADIDGHPILEKYILNPVWGSGAKNSSATPFSMKRSLNTVSSCISRQRISSQTDVRTKRDFC